MIARDYLVHSLSDKVLLHHIRGYTMSSHEHTARHSELFGRAREGTVEGTLSLIKKVSETQDALIKIRNHNHSSF